jgi:hypothetical protein
MVNQGPQYRGRLIYTQEYGYKLVTMKVKLSTDERSEIIIHCHYLDIREEAEHHYPFPPHNPDAMDVYSFPVADENEITLTITSQDGDEHQAHYTVHENGVDEDSQFFFLDIVRSRDGTDKHRFQPHHDLDIDFER